MHESTPHAATGDSNAEPAEDSARDAALGRAVIITQPSIARRVSASSAFEPREEGTLDSLILSASFLRVSASKIACP